MQTILIIGYGDVARRFVARHSPPGRLYALTRGADGAARARAQGIVPIRGDLDRGESLRRIAGIADTILHFAPPPASGERDARTRRLVAALSRGSSLPQRLVYIGTTGVYGDCGGEWVSESTPRRPATSRARRRADAEDVLRAWGRRTGVRVSILRVPGLYAAERLPLERLRKGTPVLVAEDDVFTNRVHAEDLARIARAAVFRGRPARVYNAADDEPMKMGDYFDRVADRVGLPRLPRVARAQAGEAISPAMLSYLAESRRLLNRRIKRELRVRLGYPAVNF